MFLDGQFFAEGGARQVDAALIQGAGDVGEVNPLEEAMGGAYYVLGVALDAQFGCPESAPSRPVAAS